jgi:Xaa-Pro dipeptidase
MITRRDFTKLAGLAAGTVLTSAEVQSQQSNEAALPPSIAQLKSRKDEARPITVAERRQRLERARQLMRDNKLDAMFMIGGTSLLYFTNIRWWNSERLFAAIVPAKGEPFYVCPSFEEDRAREQIATGPGGSKADVRTWQEDRIHTGWLPKGSKTAELPPDGLALRRERPSSSATEWRRLRPA